MAKRTILFVSAMCLASYAVAGWLPKFNYGTFDVPELVREQVEEEITLRCEKSSPTKLIVTMYDQAEVKNPSTEMVQHQHRLIFVSNIKDANNQPATIIANLKYVSVPNMPVQTEIVLESSLCE